MSSVLAYVTGQNTNPSSPCSVQSQGYCRDQGESGELCTTDGLFPFIDAPAHSTSLSWASVLYLGHSLAGGWEWGWGTGVGVWSHHLFSLVFLGHGVLPGAPVGGGVGGGGGGTGGGVWSQVDTCGGTEQPQPAGPPVHLPSRGGGFPIAPSMNLKVLAPLP